MTHQQDSRAANTSKAGKEEESMLAIVQDGYGSADVLHIQQVAPPKIADHEVLVRVHAAGFDRGRWHMITGKPYLLRLFFGFRKPRNRIPGLDLAGTVTAVGQAVTGFAPGDEVYGFGKGSFAQYATAPESKLALKPANTTFEQAAAVPVSALTALQALEAGRVKAGQHVLILGASGGVGTYALQLAKAFGADVTGVASTAKLNLVRALGADHVLDYTRDDFADGARRYDLILDLAGNPSPSRLRRALTPSGTAVIVGGEDGGSWTGSMDRQLRALALSSFVEQRLTMLVAKENARDLERLTELIETGRVTPLIDRTYPLDQITEAMRYMEAGKTRGKLVITVFSAKSKNSGMPLEG